MLANVVIKLNANDVAIFVTQSFVDPSFALVACVLDAARAVMQDP